MKLYSGSTAQLFEDTARNQIAGKLVQAFLTHFGRRPGDAEVASWQNSLRALALTFQRSNLNDHGVLLEYKLPLTSKRLDCMICGHDEPRRRAERGDHRAQAVGHLRGVLRREPDARPGSAAPIRDDPAPVRAGRPLQAVPRGHAHGVPGRRDAGSRSHACSYLHNYYPASRTTRCTLPRSAQVLLAVPVLLRRRRGPADRVPDRAALAAARGSPVLQRVEGGKYRAEQEAHGPRRGGHPGQPRVRPPRRAARRLRQGPRLRGEARLPRRAARPSSSCKGGPGTGKSVIAINLMADLAARATTPTTRPARARSRRRCARHRRPAGRPSSSTSTATPRPKPNAIDVLICDEAHRIRKTSATATRRRSERIGLAAGRRAPRRRQGRRVPRRRPPGRAPGGDRLVGVIRKARALEKGCQVLEYELEAQFRCAGSDAFVSWVNNTLGIRRTANVLWTDTEAFDFRIFGSPEELEAAIAAKAREGHSARMTAGFCWPWSNPRRDGTLVEDVDDRRVPRGPGTRSPAATGSRRASRRRRSGRTTRAASTRSAASTRRRGSSSTTSG